MSHNDVPVLLLLAVDGQPAHHVESAIPENVKTTLVTMPNDMTKILGKPMGRLDGCSFHFAHQRYAI